jgi:hypothetical protein
MKKQCAGWRQTVTPTSVGNAIEFMDFAPKLAVAMAGLGPTDASEQQWTSI